MFRTGTKLGPYEILAPLGAGGMGAVWRARDSRLNREVAIKVLPGHLWGSSEARARFEREAKAISGLTHPHVCTLFDVGHQDGVDYLVMELLEGETLAAWLKRGRLPIDEALRFAAQIAAALEAAHEKGVIHRDLKPGNVMVTPDGRVKVLDFGLARVADASAIPTFSPRADGANSPTMTVTSPAYTDSPTIPGAIMGTAGYMSPEQARGKPVDKRSDIFSFGCVLYEMLTGEMPFRGEIVADAIGATLHKESDLSLLPPCTPRRVRELLTSCLAKDRKNRLHDIGDARLELERAMAEPGDGVLGVVAPRRMWIVALP